MGRWGKEGQGIGGVFSTTTTILVQCLEFLIGNNYGRGCGF